MDIVLDWYNPKKTRSDIDIFIRGYLGDLYDGMIIDGSTLTIKTFPGVTPEQESYVRSWYYSINEIPAIVTTTSPLNQYDLKPYGLHHSHINSSQHINDITLSNKNGKDYTYECLTATPAYYDCLQQNHSVIRDGVYSVSGNVITTFFGSLIEGSACLCKPFDIDYTLPEVEGGKWYLWGIFISAKDYGDDDLLRLQVCDTTGVGVTLGWYSQAEFDAMGSFYLVKEYDECWATHVEKLIHLKTPDGAPGELVQGLTLRVKYYPKDVTKTDIKVWADYILTVKS